VHKARLSFFRPVLATVGVLLLLLGLFMGVGWIAARRSAWLNSALGEKPAQRVVGWYVAFMADWMADDRDGDDICEGVNLFYGQTRFNTDVVCVSHRVLLGYCGERLHTRWLQYADGVQFRWPRGFSVSIAASGGPMLLLKGEVGQPVDSLLDVPVNERGEVEFDILAERSTAGSLIFHIGDQRPYGDQTVQFPGERSAEFAWTGNFMIEASRTGRGESWVPVGYASIANDAWTYELPAAENISGHVGSLKFRFVPIHRLRPPWQ
jgi:hypothetical protein